jgi:O-antigen ligase
LKIRFSNRIGLLALIGVVACVVLVGVTYPGNPYLAALFGVLGIISFIIFAIYLYKFVFYTPQLDLPDEEEAESQVEEKE